VQGNSRFFNLHSEAFPVIPTKVGIQPFLDPRFRGDDDDDKSLRVRDDDP
jgi:hypothetical protein